MANANLQFTMHCTASKPACVTVIKCCCPPGNVPASGVPVTIKLNGTRVAGGSTNGDGVYCFVPCVTGNYTIVLDPQGNCSGGTYPQWSVFECGGQTASIPQPGKPGYFCCNGIQVPSQVLITDSNGSWPGFMISGASADAPSVPHAGDIITSQQKGYLSVTSGNKLACLTPLGGTCTKDSPWYATVSESVFTSHNGPLSYGYGLLCGRDDMGVYLELSAVWGFSVQNSNDYAYNTITCCFNGFFMTPYDCRIGADLGTVDYEPGPSGYCIPTPPQPNGPCKSHVFYGGGSYTAYAVVPRVYISGACSLQSGPWSFDLSPGPTQPTGIVPSWQFESAVDCPPGTFNGFPDLTIAPPPPGGSSVLVSGYFP